jgi:hypothetical protein
MDLGKDDMQIAAVKRLLQDAFPGQHERPDLSLSSHQECVELRSRLIALRSEDLPFYLRDVLLDLLGTHGSKSGETEDAEYVTQYLNPAGPQIDPDFIRRLYGEEGLAKHLSDQDLLKQDKLQEFQSFTSAQKGAICQWLRLARNWTELQPYADEIQQAIEWWEKAKVVAQ